MKKFSKRYKMKKTILALFCALSSIISSRCYAQEFFDTSESANFFTFGARLGFNTSNRTFPAGHHNLWNHNSWGLGFNLGVQGNINFRDYLTIQPGIFFTSHCGNYSYVTEYLDYIDQVQTHYEMGNYRSYYVTIPLMGIVKFNISSQLKWLVEAGPYYQLYLSGTGQDNINVIYRLPQSNQYDQYTAQLKKYDVGLKIGTGFRAFGHYYIGMHYLAGFMDAWKLPVGGRNKSWEFTLGYDF